MVWTDVSGMLAVVSLLVLVVAFTAIVFQETMGTGQPSLTRRRPVNADLSDDERREAMRRYDAWN